MENSSLTCLTVSDAQWKDFVFRENDPYAATKYEMLLSWMGDVEGRSAIVIGSGSGELCAILAGRGAAVHAIDVEQRCIDLTQATAKKFGVTLTSAVSRLEDLSSEKKYDFVIATDVIEHIQDDQMAVKKLRDLVVQDGKLVISVPALQSLMGYHDEILGHFRRYDKKSLRSLLTTYFQEEHVRYLGFCLIPVTYVVSCFLRRPYPTFSQGEAKPSQKIVWAVLRLILKIESYLNLGLGTSLLYIGSPRKKN